MPDPIHADPRLELVDLDELRLDEFPPIDQWSDDDWDEAIAITRAARLLDRVERGEEELIPYGPASDR